LELPSDWFTQDSLTTFAGATFIVFVLTNTIRVVFKFEWLGVPLLLSLLVVFIGAGSVSALDTPGEVLIAVANSALLFLTAVGAQETVSRF
jgi:hypothetical protein